MINDFAILNEQSLDLNEVSVILTIVSDELSHNLNLFAGINFHSWTVEVFDISSIWVEITAVFVADAIESMAIIITAVNTFAFLLSSDVTWMGSISR